MSHYRKKILLGFFLVSVLSGLALGAYLYNKEISHFKATTAASYEAVALQLSQLLGFPLKIYDLASVERIMHQSAFASKAHAVAVFTVDQRIVFSFPTDGDLVLSKECNGIFNEQKIEYADERVGSIRYCLADEHRHGNTVVLMIFLAVTLSILLFLTLFWWVERSTRDITLLVSTLDSIEVENPGLLNLSNEVKDPSIKNLYEKLEALLQKLYEAAAQQAKWQRANAITQTTQMLAHDLRRPFTILKSGIQLLEMAETKEKFVEYLTTFKQEIRRTESETNSLLRDLQDLGRPAAAHSEFVVLGDLVKECVKHCPSDTSKIRVTINSANEDTVYVDISQITRVVQNIFENAVHALRGHGQITIDTSVVNASDEKMVVRLKIGNDGPSIKEEDLQKLFEPFFTKGKKSGSGLGLAIAKNFVEINGGSIRVSSTSAPWTEFVIDLPLSSRDHHQV